MLYSNLIPKTVFFLLICGISTCNLLNASREFYNSERDSSSKDVGKKDSEHLKPRDSGNDSSSKDIGGHDSHIKVDLDTSDTALPTEFTLNWKDGTASSGTIITGQILSQNLEMDESTWTSKPLPRATLGRFSAIQWNPQHLYGHALPNDQITETGYPLGNIDMSQNVILLHFDGKGEVSGQEDILDSSSTNTGFDVHKVGLIKHIDGIFKEGLRIGKTDSLRRKPNNSTQFGTNDFSWTLWAKTKDCIGDNNVFIGGEGNNGTHLWIGCDTNDCNKQFGGFALNNEEGRVHCGSNLADNQWHFLTMVKSELSNGKSALRYYIDGKEDGGFDYDFKGHLFDFAGSHDFVIGAFPFGDYGADVSIDEVAIFKKKLDKKDIEDHYRRGVANIFISYRFCKNENCEGAGAFSQEVVDSGQQYPPTTPIDDTGGGFLQIKIRLIGKGLGKPSLLGLTLIK